jgi:hypothetical protein
VPPTERTQRLTPEPAVRSGSGTVEMARPEATPARSGSGTVEVSRPEIPPPDKTQRLDPEETPAPASLENFRLGLEEPAPPQHMEKTAQLSATDISKILHRESALTTPTAHEPAEEEESEEFSVPPAMVDFHGGKAPVAFEDMLRTPEQTEETEEEEAESRKSNLGLAAFEAAEEQASTHEAEAPEEEQDHDEAEVHFGGIREEAKSPDPERPPIPVEFGHSEPMEIITEEHVESSGMEIGASEGLVSSSSGWAASTGSGEPHAGSAGEPGLMSGGAQAIMTPPTSPHAGGIAREEAAPVHEFAIPPEPAAAPSTPAEFEETSELPKHILQEEVNRAQEIAARVAAQNREFAAQEDAQGPPIGGPLRAPVINQVISAADTLLARHRAEAAAASAAPPVAEPLPVPPASLVPVAAPPAAPTAEGISQTVVVPRAGGPEMLEAISERVLAQLDPYLIEKISKEIVKPIVEAMIRRELEKLE